MKETNIFIAYWMNSLWVKAALSTNSARLGFFRWCFCSRLQLKIKVTINNPIYPVLKWFCEWCTETGTNNIQAEMFFETLKCTILEMTGVQAQQAAASIPAASLCVTGVDTKGKCTHMFYLRFFSCHVNPMGTEIWFRPSWDFLPLS